MLNKIIMLGPRQCHLTKELKKLGNQNWITWAKEGIITNRMSWEDDNENPKIQNNLFQIFKKELPPYNPLTYGSTKQSNHPNLLIM